MRIFLYMKSPMWMQHLVPKLCPMNWTFNMPSSWDILKKDAFLLDFSLALSRYNLYRKCYTEIQKACTPSLCTKLNVSLYLTLSSLHIKYIK